MTDQENIQQVVKQVQMDISNLLTNCTTINFRCSLILAGISFDLKAREYEANQNEVLLEELREDYKVLQRAINKFNYMLQRSPERGGIINEEQTGSN